MRNPKSEGSKAEGRDFAAEVGTHTVNGVIVPAPAAEAAIAKRWAARDAKLARGKVPTLKTGDDEEVAAQLLALYGKAQNAMRRVGALGLFCFEVKFVRLKHGQWKHWVAANCPTISGRTINAYMQITESALRWAGVKKIKPWILALSAQILSALNISNCGDLLLLPDAPVPEKLRKVRQGFYDVVDGKTMRQLFAEFKQVDADGRVKKGNLSGRGNPKAQRDKGQMTKEQLRIDLMEVQAIETTEWLLEVADDKHLGLIDEKIRRKLREAIATAAGYLSRLERGEEPVFNR